MKRTILLLFSVASIFFGTSSCSDRKNMALQYAKQFLNQTSRPQYAPGKVSAALVEAEPTYVAHDTASGTPLYYIYNLSNDGGFVIVAADTRVRTILGYSFNVNFEEKNIPVNMREWLNEYSSQIAYAIKHIPASDTMPVVSRSKSVNNAVEPLLGDIKYDQYAPYNNLCPMDGDERSLTGCVATAMAQIMRYHKHPQVGRGTKTYTTPILNQELTVDFSTAYYDWENMLPIYDATATDVQQTAIATLMYHAGVAVEMKYSAAASSANLGDEARAFYEHFDYDIGIDVAFRTYYSANEWLQLIKNELDEARPIAYGGYGAMGGHEFVCDGYDADDFVHINWGWGGYYDGYFHLSAFNLDIAGNIDLNVDQSIIYGIQKPVEGSVPKIAVMGMSGITTDKDSISAQDTVRFQVFKLRTCSVFGFKGQIALALYNENGDFIQTISLFSTTLPAAGWGWYSSYTFKNITMSDIRPNDSTVGKFYIKPVYRPEGTEEWKPALVGKGKVGEVYAEIADSVIRFTLPDMRPILTEAAPAVVKNNALTIFEGNNLNVELQIANSGHVEYRAQVGVKAISLANDSDKYEIASVKTILPIGETTTINLSGLIDFPEGEYRLEAYYDPANQENDFSFPAMKIESNQDTTQFTVLTKPEPYSLSLAEATEMPSEIVQRTPFTFKATITNTGGPFAGNLVLFILKARNDGTNNYDYIYETKPYYVEIFTETKEVAVEYTLESAPGSGYVAMLFYIDNATGTYVSLATPEISVFSPLRQSPL